MEKQKKLRCGYTTGSCAAAAAKAAVFMLLSGKELTSVSLTTPNGTVLTLPLQKICCQRDDVTCAVQKDSGDDPDITNGVLVFAKAEFAKNGISIAAGEGIGRVTKKGLDQPVGEAAINRVPRRMLMEQVTAVCDAFGYMGGLLITLFIPGGAELAQKTFNPRLGIVGGLSILGTTGIVEPMSEKALWDSICVEMRMRVANGADTLILTPGNYGQAFLRENYALELEESVKISNFVGDALEYAASLSVKGVLLVGHVGKLIKLAGGIFQTHSRYGDCRMELLGVYSALAGAERSLLEEILASATTEQALSLLKEAGLMETVMERILYKIEEQIHHRTGQLACGVLLFSNGLGTLCQSENVPRLLQDIRAEG